MDVDEIMKMYRPNLMIQLNKPPPLPEKTEQKLRKPLKTKPNKNKHTTKSSFRKVVKKKKKPIQLKKRGRKPEKRTRKPPSIHNRRIKIDFNSEKKEKKIQDKQKLIMTNLETVRSKDIHKALRSRKLVTGKKCVPRHLLESIFLNTMDGVKIRKRTH